MQSNMSDEKNSFTFHFHAPVGQQIAHVDKIEAHFDKDMNMQVMNPGGATVTTSPKADNPVAPFDWDLMPFIHPQWLTNDAKCHAIYNHLKTLLHQEPSVVCSQLHAMHESKLLMLSGVPTKTIYQHLKNMGFSCPESTFYDKYKAPK